MCHPHDYHIVVKRRLYSVTFIAEQSKSIFLVDLDSPCSANKNYKAIEKPLTIHYVISRVTRWFCTLQDHPSLLFFLFFLCVSKDVF